MIKHILKFLFVGIVMVLIGWGILQYLSKQTDSTGQSQKQSTKETARIAQDTYGATTPEETLRLFVAALKKGNTELAAKYFVLDKQQDWREQLSLAQEKGLLGDMMKDFEKIKKEKIAGNTATYLLGVSETQLTLIRISGRWKIQDF